LKNQFASSTAQPRLLNVREAASYLATSVHAIRKLQWSKTVPFLRIGKQIQFDRQDLDAFITSQKSLSS
jgi:excisionase family DNA binding protein